MLIKNVEIENHPSENDCIIITDKSTKVKKTVCTIQMYQGDHAELIQSFKERTLFFKNECNKQMPTVPGLKFA